MAPLIRGNYSDRLCASCWMNADRMCMRCCWDPSTDKNNPRADTTNTYYCSSACEESARSSHEQECISLQARKQLFRVAGTLQSIFYTYREIMYDKHVERIVRRKEKIYIYEAEKPESKRPVDVLKAFPHKLFCTKDEIDATVAQIVSQSKNKHAFQEVPTENMYQGPGDDTDTEGLRERAKQMLGGLDRDDKRAVLVQNTCDDAVGWMVEIIKHMFGDLVSSFEEVVFKTKNNRLDLVSVRHTGEERHSSAIDLDHIILKITMKQSDECYALDLTGAQYGYADPLTLWDEYKRTRIERFVMEDGPRRFGANKELLQKLADDGSLLCQMNLFAAGTLEFCPTLWEKENGIGWKDVRKLPWEEYKHHEEELLGYIQKRLQEMIEMHHMYI